MLQIKNLKTKNVKKVSEKEWETIQKNPLTSKLWGVIDSAKVPPEIKELEKKQEQQKKGTSTDKTEEVK